MFTLIKKDCYIFLEMGIIYKAVKEQNKNYYDIWYFEEGKGWINQTALSFSALEYRAQYWQEYFVIETNVRGSLVNMY